MLRVFGAVASIVPCLTVLLLCFGFGVFSTTETAKEETKLDVLLSALWLLLMLADSDTLSLLASLSYSAMILDMILALLSCCFFRDAMSSLI